LKDFCSVDDEQNGVVQVDSQAAEGGSWARGESNVVVDSDNESGTDYDADYGSESGDDDSSEDDESNGYATP